VVEVVLLFVGFLRHLFPGQLRLLEVREAQEDLGRSLLLLQQQQVELLLLVLLLLLLGGQEVLEEFHGVYLVLLGALGLLAILILAGAADQPAYALTLYT
jgi:hypothetical protein